MKYQELKIQEHNDQVPVGNIPRSMTIVTRYTIASWRYWQLQQFDNLAQKYLSAYVTVKFRLSLPNLTYLYMFIVSVCVRGQHTDLIGL